MNNILSLLKEQFPKKEEVVTEIINLEAILNLPKSTEHFVSDVHGEFESIDYVLRNGSGSIVEKVKDTFGELDVSMRDEICNTIVYPEEMIKKYQNDSDINTLNNWYKEIIPLLLQIVNQAGRKYTKSKIRKRIPDQFQYIIEELLSENYSNSDKQNYISTIIDKIIELNQAPDIIVTLGILIQRLTVDHLHVVGDIYDRGPNPDLIVERLMELPSVDIQWGNHDIVWIAAVCGSPVAICNLLRISSRYGNIRLIEDQYGINIRLLSEYSRKYYKPVPRFSPIIDDKSISQQELDLFNQIQQATAILQFKLESQLITRRPEFMMTDRQLLNEVNYIKKTVTLNDITYPLTDFYGPTINADKPDELTHEEETLILHLIIGFQQSEKLRRHIDFLMNSGSMYLCYNNNLLFHGCIPITNESEMDSFCIEGDKFSGKQLLDLFEQHVRLSYQHPEDSYDFSTDLLWYLWAGEKSPLFGKQSMKTFERYYVLEKNTHKEIPNSYYQMRDNEEICKKILASFNLPVDGHIINGHTPVKEKKGENPIKANSRLIVIDGGYARCYQKTTGVAGYTLIFNSYGMQLAAHQPFLSVENALQSGSTTISVNRLVDETVKRITVRDTTIGKVLLNKIQLLHLLYEKFDNI